VDITVVKSSVSTRLSSEWNCSITCIHSCVYKKQIGDSNWGGGGGFFFVFFCFFVYRRREMGRAWGGGGGVSLICYTYTHEVL